MNLTHDVANYSEGFTNADGTLTNTIENSWPHVRSPWRARHSLNRNRLKDFIREFKFLNLLKDKKQQKCKISIYWDFEIIIQAIKFL